MEAKECKLKTTKTEYNVDQKLSGLKIDTKNGGEI